MRLIALSYKKKTKKQNKTNKQTHNNYNSNELNNRCLKNDGLN